MTAKIISGICFKSVPFPGFLRIIIISLSVSSSVQLYSQYIPHPLNNYDVYSFLDEFSLPYNAAIKPYGRTQIYDLLNSLDNTTLSLRQQKELSFYLRDFNKGSLPKGSYKKRIDLYYHEDSLFSLTVNPILGADLWTNKNGFEYHWWNGAEAWASIGKLGIFVSLRDNHESSALTNPYYLNKNNDKCGSGYKVLSDGKIDYEEIRGGITYAWPKVRIGLIKDNFSWGTNYNGSNILSGRPPSFVHLDLQVNPVRWLDFHYIHGWLNSEQVDSIRSFYVTNAYGTNFRRFYLKKFIAANMFTFYPIPLLGLSVGNSIIYDYNNIHPAFLVPVMFFKALDHSLNFGIKNMNSQMFFDISSRNIDHVHLYSSLFIDELAIKRIIDPDEYNFISFKGGARISNLPANTFACIEYTITNALTFRHDVPTTTFESNKFNLGHYLTDNAREFFLTAGYKPIRNAMVQISYTNAMKGPDHTELGTMPREAIKPFTPVVWKRRSMTFQASWQPLNDLFIRLGYEWSNITGEQEALIKYTPEFLWGKTGTMNVGMNYGF